MIAGVEIKMGHVVLLTSLELTKIERRAVFL